jgi:uncharacterized membrane protein
MAIVGGIICVFVIAIAGLAAYRLRRSRRFCYGLIEIVVSLAVIFLTVFPQTSYLALEGDQGQSWLGWLLYKSVGALTGIYVLVRGLDNMGHDLPKVLLPVWERIFGKMTGPGGPGNADQER